MGNISITDIDNLGHVNSESNDIETNMFTTGIPSSGSDAAVSSNVLGKVRTLSIKGVFEGEEADINVFIQQVEAWINESGFGNFQANKTYTDSFGNKYTVLASRFTWNRLDVSIGFIEYTLEMKEGRTISTIVLGEGS